MNPDPDPGGPKTYGSDGSGFGSGSQHCLEVVDLAPLLLHPVLEVVHLCLLHLAEYFVSLFLRRQFSFPLKGPGNEFFLQLYQNWTVRTSMHIKQS